MTAVRRTSLKSGTVPFPTVDTIKILLGIDPTDTSKDAAIAVLLAACVAMLENYCSRTFQNGDYVEEFEPLSARDPTLMLSAWPVQTINSVTRDGVALTDYRLYPNTGMLRQWVNGSIAYRPPGAGWSSWSWWWCGDHAASIIVDYVGGYPDDAWPADLVGVLLSLFGARWRALGGDGNPANDTTGRGAIKAFTVDATRIEYDLGDSSTGAVIGVETGEIPPDLAPFAAQLAPYVDQRIWGV